MGFSVKEDKLKEEYNKVDINFPANTKLLSGDLGFNNRSDWEKS